MGQQFIETINMYQKSIKKLYPSEYGSIVNRESNQLQDKVFSMIFNKQYEIFYYEPCSKNEALKMIKKFEEKIEELKHRWIYE